MANNETVTAGRKALDECQVAYADMPATEVELGFGDCHADWRAPLAQVKIYNEAMEKEAADTETEIKTYVEYGAEGETLTGAGAAEKAKEYHEATEGKKKLLWKYYPEVLEEKYPEDAAAFKAAEEAAKNAEAGAGVSTGENGD